MDLQIDGATILSEGDLHDVLDRALDFGPYYGRNLYALRDRLNYDVERPLRIVWLNHHLSRRAMGDRFGMIVNIFQHVIDSDVEAHVDSPFAYILA